MSLTGNILQVGCSIICVSCAAYQIDDFLRLGERRPRSIALRSREGGLIGRLARRRTVSNRGLGHIVQFCPKTERRRSARQVDSVLQFPRCLSIFEPGQIRILPTAHPIVDLLCLLSLLLIY